MRIETVMVTPEMAEHWLASAAGLPQRALTRARVANFASAMTRGQWRVTHQAVAIDTDGVLIDGQHRLSAVVSSGETVAMSVAYDVDRETFAMIDTGQARTPASTLHIAGVTDANATAAAVRLVLLYDLNAGTRRAPHSQQRSGFTSTDVLNFVQSDRGRVLHDALTAASALAQVFGRYGMRTWMGAALTVIDETKPDAGLRADFLDKLSTGAMLPEGSPILTFRRWVVSDTGYLRMDRSNRGASAMAVFIKTWNAWLFGKDLSQLRFRAGNETWPLPGRDTEALDAAQREEERLAAERVADLAATGQLIEPPAEPKPKPRRTTVRRGAVV